MDLKINTNQFQALLEYRLWEFSTKRIAYLAGSNIKI